MPKNWERKQSVDPWKEVLQGGGSGPTVSNFTERSSEVRSKLSF